MHSIKCFFSRFNTIPFTLSSLVQYTLDTFNTPYELFKIERFREMNSNRLGTATEAFSEVIETIKTNIRWMAKNVNRIDEWLHSVTL